jgi:hypothetical protein
MADKRDSNREHPKSPDCFVIMPISDCDGY